MNDPKWERFPGTSANFSDDAGTAGQRGVPTVGIGAYCCNDPACGKPHMAIACIDENGREISILIEPQRGADIAKTIVEKLGEIGGPYLAVKAMRALTMMNEIATMTDTEADFLDGPALRESCRLVLYGGDMVIGAILPRRYGEEDVERAIAAMDRESASSAPDYRRRMVHAVAEALGMTRAGD